MDAAPDAGADAPQSAIGEVCGAAVNAAASALPLDGARCLVLCFADNGDVEVHAVADAAADAVKAALGDSPGATVSAADLERLMADDPSGESPAAPKE